MDSASTKLLHKILVVEDDLYMQNILRHYLSSEFEVTAFANGLEALSYLQSGNIPDLIVADLNTPALSGLELIQQMKASGFFSAVPILILSGEDSTNKRISCLEAGAEDYVVKPFNPKELSVRIKVILRRMGKIAFE